MGIRLSTRQLEYFLAVAKDLNFTKAAQAMFVSQTAVTQQIMTLEEQLGVSLFDRNKKKVELTPAGEVFAVEAQQILDRINEACTRTVEASNGSVGTIIVGFADGMVNTSIPSKLEAFKADYPNINITLVNLSPAKLLKELKAGSLDIAILPAFDEDKLTGLNHVNVDWTNLIAVVSKNHPLAGRQYVTRKDLKSADIILASTPDSEIGEDKLILESFWKYGFYPNVTDKVESMETIYMMVAANMGVAILPAYMMDTVEGKGNITASPYGGVDEKLDIVCAWMPAKNNPSIERIIPYLSK